MHDLFARSRRPASWAFLAVLACGCAQTSQRPPLPQHFTESLLASGFPGLPADARAVAECGAGCLHFGGEINGDGGARDREVYAAMESLGCDTVAEDIAAMRARYPGDPDVLEALDLVDAAE